MEFPGVSSKFCFACMDYRLQVAHHIDNFLIILLISEWAQSF
jgi:hypothetical protein